MSTIYLVTRKRKKESTFRQVKMTRLNYSWQQLKSAFVIILKPTRFSAALMACAFYRFQPSRYELDTSRYDLYTSRYDLDTSRYDLGTSNDQVDMI